MASRAVKGLVSGDEKPSIARQKGIGRKAERHLWHPGGIALIISGMLRPSPDRPIQNAIRNQLRKNIYPVKGKPSVG